MAYSDLIILLFIGCLSGSLVGLLSIGGGIIIVPLLHMLFPKVPMQDIVIISLHQILFSSFIAFITHQKKQMKENYSKNWLTIHFAFLIIAGIIVHFLQASLISWLFLLFILTSIFLRIFLAMELNFKPFKNMSYYCMTICAIFGSFVGVGGSLLLYPILRIYNQNYTRALKQCAFNSFTVGLMGVVTHDIIYFLNMNHYFPWVMMVVVAGSSAVTARMMALRTYNFSQKTIDHASTLLSIVVFIGYYYYL